MSYYDEDFYYEPSEFDVQVNGFRESLLKSVKEDFISEMEKLKAENVTLQSVKNDFEQIKREYEDKKRELERDRSNLQSKMRRERLVDLLKDHQIILYKAYSKRECPPKCDKCDGKRKIQYISPLGRKTSEDCLCNEGKTIFFPQEFVRYEFKLNRDGSVIAWYRQYSR